MSRTNQRGPARIEANLTAFIDVTFLLIIFFILVAQISTTERPMLPLPQIDERASQPLNRGERLIINCVSRGEEAAYLVGAETYRGDAGVRRLAEVVRLWTGRSEPEPIAVRAERTLPYEYVEPVLELLRELGAEPVELIVIPPREFDS
jgi:biopolymer transport protein ExbD